MQTIYVDVLIVLNIYVNFFLLRITSGVTHSPLKNGRCIAASAYGSIFSLLILAPELNSVFVTAIKLAAAVTIVMLAFGIHGKKRLLKNTAAFFVSNIVLAGMIYAVYSWLSPEFVHIGNSFFYIDFSLIILVASTAALYIIVCLAKRIAVKGSSVSESCHVFIRYKDKSVNLCGLADTGNALTDFFTGTPVLVCDKENFLPESSDETDLPKGFRFLPCNTVSGNGVIPIFRPDEVIIMNDVSGEKKPVDVMVGLGKSSGKAIFHPDILKR
jgi:sigma-E processing peptidase SpoIIGA